MKEFKLIAVFSLFSYHNDFVCNACVFRPSSMLVYFYTMLIVSMVSFGL